MAREKMKDDGCKVQNVKGCRTWLRIGKWYLNFKQMFFFVRIEILIT